MVPLHLLQLGFQPLVRCRVRKIAWQVVDPIEKPAPDFGIYRAGAKNLVGLVKLLAIRLCREVVDGKTDKRELTGQEVGGCQIVECGDQLALSQISTRPEDHHQARASGLTWYWIGLVHRCGRVNARGQ